MRRNSIPSRDAILDPRGNVRLGSWLCENAESKRESRYPSLYQQRTAFLSAKCWLRTAWKCAAKDIILLFIAEPDFSHGQGLGWVKTRRQNKQRERSSLSLRMRTSRGAKAGAMAPYAARMEKVLLRFLNRPEFSHSQGHSRHFRLVRRMSAYPPTAAGKRTLLDFAFGPEADEIYRAPQLARAGRSAAAQ